MSQTRAGQPSALGAAATGASAQPIHSPLVSPGANAGQSSPLGATVCSGGANFSLYSRGATAIELLLFAKEEDVHPAHVPSLHETVKRTYPYWNVLIAPSTIVMFSFPVWERGSFLDIASMDHSIPPEGCVLMLPRSCSTRTVA